MEGLIFYLKAIDLLYLTEGNSIFKFAFVNKVVFFSSHTSNIISISICELRNLVVYINIHHRDHDSDGEVVIQQLIAPCRECTEHEETRV